MSLLLFSLGFLYGQAPDLESGREHEGSQFATQENNNGVPIADSTYISDSTFVLSADSLSHNTFSVDSMAIDSTSIISADSASVDTLETKQFLDDVMSGSNQDSLVYDVKGGFVSIYEQGDISYQNMNIKADFMRVDMNTKEIYAHGRLDTTTNVSTRPEFIEGNSSYTMDTLTYNIDSQKARIKGVQTQDGDGILRGVSVKKMADNTINISKGRYTTCDAD
ncbi:MAG: LPS-assembly protein LptD, partial [Rikenellaceae bacterium]